MENIKEKDSIIKSPIKRTLIISSIILSISVLFLVTLISILLVHELAHSRNEKDLGLIINYVESKTDVDDLYECKQTGVKSEQYLKFQVFLNELVDSFDVDYLYIVDPSNGVMTNVISATSKEEKENGEVDMEIGETTNAYSPKEIERYNRAWNQEGIVYFEETSDYGEYFTACKLLKTTDGVGFALICADVDVASIHTSIFRTVAFISLTTLLLLIIFVTVLFILLRKRVTGPIISLEESVCKFSKECIESDELLNTSYSSPNIETKNEVESLAKAIEQMAFSLKEKAKESIEAMGKVDDLVRREQEYETNLTVARMQVDIDALTGVKNKHAYIDVEAELNNQIENNENVKFAIVICDVNGLKNINDTNGHVAGDEYLRSACKVICDIFKHSPVFRFGGDEFVVIVQGEDYDKVNKLTDMIKNCNIHNLVTNEMILACGYAIFSGDKNVATVFNRADSEMYKNKREIKDTI